jgi:hypothetical protein
MKSLSEQRTKNMKVIQEKMKLNQKEVKRFNPVSSCLLSYPCFLDMLIDHFHPCSIR